MPVTFVKSANASTGGVALGVANQDVFVHKVIVGAPVNSGNVGIYTITNPLPSFNANNDAQLAFKMTYTSSVSESSTRVIDFTSNGQAGGTQSGETQGLLLTSGGNVMVDQNMQVTVIWDNAS